MTCLPCFAGESRAVDGFFDEVEAFHRIEADDETANEMKLMRLTRCGRHLLSLLQEQRALFLHHDIGGPNEAAARVEERMNEANLSASEGAFDQAIILLTDAYRIVTDSLVSLKGDRSSAAPPPVQP